MLVSMESEIQGIANNSTGAHTDIWCFARAQCTGFMNFFGFTSLKMTRGLALDTRTNIFFSSCG